MTGVLPVEARITAPGIPIATEISLDFFKAAALVAAPVVDAVAISWTVVVEAVVGAVVGSSPELVTPVVFFCARVHSFSDCVAARATSNCADRAAHQGTSRARE